MTNVRTGGRILVDNLVAQGCDRIFTVPGESFLALFVVRFKRGNDSTSTIARTRRSRDGRSPGSG
jgi:hypothetical protein